MKPNNFGGGYMKKLLNNHKKLKLILLTILVLALIIVIIQLLRDIGYEKSNKDIATTVRVVEEQNSIKTTENEYNNMIKECRNTVYNSYTLSSNIDTEITISESTFIDSDEQTESEYESLFTQVNTIYCNDFILVSFINKSGEMKSVTSVINRDTDEIKTVDINRVSSLEQFNEYNTNNRLNSIGNIVVSIIKSDKSELNNLNTSEYFTEAGYNEFIAELNEDISIDNIEVTFMKLGKSSLDIEYNDRILAQFTTTDSSRSICINTIIKLDSNGKIFDIDII